ncbi:MAG: hypothetical protein CMK44_04560 [Porticoccus sp.]|jgi:hypothetical protein|nr:hypothetical protein [Porticoccus sp.]|tara:strand:+ start:203 stop:439 length:237 start_codon:yes stop_codon:yes gene_type:complete
MKIVMLYILSMVCTNIVAHPGSPLDGTHTETLAIVLMMTGILLATIASTLIIKGYTHQMSESSDKNRNIAPISNKRMG